MPSDPQDKVITVIPQAQLRLLANSLPEAGPEALFPFPETEGPTFYWLRRTIIGLINAVLGAYDHERKELDQFLLQHKGDMSSDEAIRLKAAEMQASLVNYEVMASILWAYMPQPPEGATGDPDIPAGSGPA